MATNRYFKNYQNANEQVTLENMLIEQIAIFGEDVYYMPRKLNNLDKLYGADDVSSFESAYLIEMYIKNYEGFEGDGNFMSLHGLDIKDKMTFTLAKRVFDDEIGKINNFKRPREGDLIYWPLNKKSFQIRFVNNKETFYQLGALYTYELSCELFDYSSEYINTGIPEIDSLQISLSLNEFDYGIDVGGGFLLATEEGDIIVDEDFDVETIDPASDNEHIQTESDVFMDWTEIDPFSANGQF